MKKVKFAFAGLAVFTAVTTMSFTMAESKSKAADPGDDCWSSIERLENNLPADVNQQQECPGNTGTCCFKVGESYSENAM